MTSRAAEKRLANLIFYGFMMTLNAMFAVLTDNALISVIHLVFFFVFAIGLVVQYASIELRSRS